MSSSPIIFKHNYSISKSSPHSSQRASTSPLAPSAFSSKRSSSIGLHKAIQMSASGSSSCSSSSISSSSSTMSANHHHRRRPSFISSNSPLSRRKSFLSKAMLENDDFQTYEMASSYQYYSSLSSANSSCLSSYSGENTQPARIPSFSINLTQSQGFLWNQDLFASSYQQAKAGLKPEREVTSNPVEVINVIVDSDSSSASDNHAAGTSYGEYDDVFEADL